MTVDSSVAHRAVTLAGHVDHGKSTLVRALTGMEPDRLPQERQHGRTIELGFVWTDLGDAGSPAERVAFIDVPGHARLVGTMISGSGVAPTAILVVAGDDGVSVQTREHLSILDLLAVPGLAIVITKIDRVDHGRVREVEAEVHRLVAGTTFENAPVVAVSATSGEGMGLLREVLRSRLLAMATPHTDRDPRLWIDRVFTMQGSGTVITGTLSDGPLLVDQALRISPSGRRVRARRLQQLGKDVGAAMPGARVAVNLVGVARQDVRRGQVLVAADMVDGARQLDAALTLLEGQRLGRGAHRLHVGTAAAQCRIRELGPRAGQDGGCLVRVTLDEPIHVRIGDRFVIRDPGGRRTVAGGFVIDPAPLRLRGSGRRTVLERLQGAAVWMGASPLDLEVIQQTWLDLGGGCRTAAGLRGWSGGGPLTGGSGGPSSGMLRRGDWVVARDLDERCRDRLVGAAAQGLARSDALRTVAALGLAPGAVQAVLSAAVADGVIVVDGESLVVPGADRHPSQQREARARSLVDEFIRRRLDPPDLVPTADSLGVGHLERQALLSSGALVRCGDVVLARATIDEAGSLLRDLQRTEGPFTASQARRALGTTRRVAIPLLEHLVRTGSTRFDGQHHRFREEAPRLDAGPERDR